jgi:hypothetical protein
MSPLCSARSVISASEANRDYFLPSVLFVVNLDHPVWREAAEAPRLRAIKDRIMRGR